MNNLELYNKVRIVPKEAQKEIVGGRLRGMTDINPMWRLKTLTEHFGICGIGWKYEIISERLEPATSGEVAAFVQINLYIRDSESGHWSDAIPGTGGSSFVAKEKNGMYVSDECFKMALTDALGVACKALGIGADVYFAKDRSKYDQQQIQSTQTPSQQPNNKPVTKENNVIEEKHRKALFASYKSINMTDDEFKQLMKENTKKESTKDLNMTEFKELMKIIEDRKVK